MKELLLAKANFKKKKSVSIAIGLIIFLASFLICLSLLLMLDAYPNTNKYAKKLNAADGFAVVYNDLADINNESLESCLNGAKDYEITEYIYYNATSIKFGKGDLVISLLINDTKAFNKTIEKTEIYKENKSIEDNYIYLPYQFLKTGNFKIGDSYNLVLNNIDHNFIIKGFTNTTGMGCNNAGYFEVIIDTNSYNNLKLESNHDALLVAYKTDKTISASKLNLQITNHVQSLNSNSLTSCSTLDSVIVNRGFMSLIISVSFLTVSIILILVLILMLVNSISSYIKENMKEIGALKAIGYKSSDIVKAILIQFSILSIVGSLIGLIFGYAFIPLMAGIVENQQGFPYSVSFNLLSTIIPFVSLVLFTFLIVLLATRKIRKIEPIVALREGLNTHNFKKNRIPLSKSKLGLNLSLSLKTLFNNISQNVITFVVMGFLTFISVIALLMFENFNRKPNLGILTFEICSGVIAIEHDYSSELYNYLDSRDDVYNIKNMINLDLIYGDNESQVFAYIMDDVTKLNNKNVCYSGRLPKYDNEIAVSGKFLKTYGYKLGDQIEFTFAGKSKKFNISGLIQTCNNGGQEALLSFDAVEGFIDLSTTPSYYWFDSTNKDVEEIFDACKELYDNHIITTMNFDKIMEAGLENFKSIASIMLVSILLVSCAVILLVLYLLIKSLMQKKKKDFGILKSLGYKSNDIILQTAFSFMPSIILSVLIFSILSYFIANPYMNLIMVNFGIMKCNFPIPILGIIIIAIFMILISFIFAIFESRRIKKIEPYSLIVE